MASKRPKCIVIKDINVFWQWRDDNVLSPEMMQIQWYLWNLNTLSSENSNCFWQWRDGKALASKISMFFGNKEILSHYLQKWCKYIVNEEKNCFWQWRDGKALSSKRFENILTKWCNVIVIEEFKSDYSQRIQLFHCHRDLNRYLQNAKKKSLPNKIVSVFGHQNWSVLIYLSWFVFSPEDFNVCGIKWLKKISRNCKSIFSGYYRTKIDRNEYKSMKLWSICIIIKFQLKMIRRKSIGLFLFQFNAF